MAFQIFVRGLNKVQWFFILVICNRISHSAFCQHLNRHQDRIIASTFIWPSGSGRFVLFLQKFKWPTLFKKQRAWQILYCLFCSYKTTLGKMVTRGEGWNVDSLNKVYCSDRCLHFAASLPEPSRPTKNLLRQKLLRGLLFLAILWSSSGQPSFWNS